MDALIRYFDGEGAKTAEGFLNYLGVHLQGSRETGGFRSVKGYLNKDGMVVPVISNLMLWRRLGWTGNGLPPEKLIKNLVMGFDMAGNKLNASRSLFKPPKEFILTLWCELSEALRDRPEIAHAILLEALAANKKCMETAATRQRSGKGRRAEADWVEAQVLGLGYLHAENRASEVAYHAHGLTFPACLDSAGNWRAFNNLAHMVGLSKAGGAREKVTDAIITEAAKWGYKVEVVRGKSKAAGSQGARVTCPDGRVIERGSVKRSRRATILAAQEMTRELGAPPLTHKQVEIVRRETGRFPVELTGVKLREALGRKLHTLGFLTQDGRIQELPTVLAALARMEEGMAVAQVSLQDLPDLPSSMDAAEIVKARRKDLVRAAPEVTPNTNLARIRWTTSYDEILELVAKHPGGLGTEDLDKPTRNNLSKLKRAGILEGEKVAGRTVYTLGPAGVERLACGRREQAEVKMAVADIVKSALDNFPRPDRVRGRLEMVGIQTIPDQGRFEVGSIGRVVTSFELMHKTGIRSSTPITPDIAWWEGWFGQLKRLPHVLRKAIMAPAEVLQKWGAALAQSAAEKIGAEARNRNELAIQAAATKQAAARQRRRMESQQVTTNLPTEPSITGHSQPEGGIGHGRTF